MGRPIFLAMMIVWLGLFAFCSPGYADPVRVRAAVHDDSGRIAFSWDLPVSYSARISGSQVTISFGRPAEADLSVIQRALPGYVERSEVSADGRTVTLHLTKPFELVHFPAGSAIVVDLVGKPGTPANTQAQQGSGTEAAPPSPATPVTSAETTPSSGPVATLPESTTSPDLSGLPEITVRTGSHADKLRLVFDWPSQANYSFERDGGVVRLVFDKPARISMKDIGKVMPAVLGDARADVNGGKTVVRLAIAQGSRIRHFYAGAKMVLDAYFPNDGSKAATLPAEVGTPASVATVAAAPSEEPAAEKLTTEAAVASTDQATVTTAALSQDDPPSGGQPVVTPENSSTDAGVTPTDLTPSGEGDQANDGPTPRTATGAITTGATATDTGFTFNFGWDEPVAAAVFRRGGAIWMVFDKPTTVDVDAMRTVAGSAFQDIAQLSHPTATVLRIVTERGINPVPRREGLSWLMDFAEQSLSTLSPVEATAQPDSPVGARVFLPVPEPGNAVPITDPEMGDNFIVVPVIPLGYGVAHFYEYPQFRIRPSSQGLVVEPLIDTLRVRPARQGVEVAGTRQLYLSPVSEEDIAKAKLDSDRSLSRIVDFKPVQDVSIDLFNETRQGIASDVAFAQGEEARRDTRLELIRFYLANSMGAEALGVLSVLADDIPDAKKRADFRLYRGMANFLMARYADAKVDLEGEQLDRNDEGMFWRSLVDFALKDKDPVISENLSLTSKIPEPYPRALRIPLEFWVVESLVKNMDTEKAQGILDALNAEELTVPERTQMTYLQGLNKEAMGDFDGAIADWESVMQGGHRPSEAYAAFARAELLLKMDRISQVEAISELEKQRFAWRGGDYEFNLLRRLGELYIRQGGFRDGLSTLRQAATYFREREEAQQVTQQMSDTFAGLYLRGQADRMAPVSAIALYEEFKELTPVADLGNEMIRKLADRLVGVDLLDEASSLLDNQIKFRLKDQEKARVGAQLAVIRILAKDYPGAMKALEISEVDTMAPELSIQRNQLRARALIGEGDYTSALVLIEEDASPEAEKLRTEAYWAVGDWSRVGKSLREQVKDSGAKPGGKLSQEQALNVLNYAIALTLGGNDRALLKLRQDYQAAMAQTDFGDAFTLIATPEQFGLIRYDSIAGRVKVAENFRDFMAAYKERLAAGGLSSIN